MVKIYFIIWVLTCNIIFAQYSGNVEGKIASRSTGEPLQNVNVYISGTTIGTTTDQNGFYKIKNIPAGKQTVVASIIGYETNSVDIFINDKQTINLSFNLKEASYELNQVNVVSEAPKEWKENLSVFKEYFLGDSPFASGCRIMNPEIINLNFDESGDLRAEANRPIIIVNDDLGYKINCDLIYFHWNEDLRKLRYVVNTFFTKLTDSTGAMEEIWKKNRKKAYYGSLINFIRSFISDTTSRDNFYCSIVKFPSVKGDIWPMNEKYSIRVIDNNIVQMNFDYYLKVMYKGPMHLSPIISYLKLNHNNVKFDRFGYPLESFSFEVYGYWSFKGVSYMLPKYYYPDKPEN